VLKRTLCLLALALAPLVGEPRADSSSPITLYTKFQVDPPRQEFDAMQQELASIMSPAGLSFRWRSLSSAAGEVSSELVIVNFRGICTTESPLGNRAGVGPLGWTHVTNHEVLPFSDIDCDRLSAFVRPAVAGLPQQKAEFALGRAMARVLAHELYHVFARTTHHGSAGVARTGHSIHELTADEFNFQEADLHILTVLRERNRYRDAGAALAEGRYLYAASGCASCHGPSGEGSLHAPRLRAADVRLTLSKLTSKLTGKPTEMKRGARTYVDLWKALGESDLESLVSYLTTVAD